ncbi:common central domain of tyrosinase-domain-containing protein [Tricladium varicosporioides]|nr:common central domain of tyrosinase-domain-containing protein [Hymenoscyphus varicosporioides]
MSTVPPKEGQAKNWCVPLVPDTAKARVEIDEFIDDNDMTNLFLLALEELYQEDALKSQAKKNEDWWADYSISDKFAPTQRAVYQKAATRFRVPFWDPILPRNKVANTGRFDEKIWSIPKICAAKQVWVKRPSSPNKLEQIPNPLYAYKFQNDAPNKKGRIPIAYNPKWKMSPKCRDHTIRAPGPDGENDDAFLNFSLQRQGVALGTNLWKFLSRYTSDGIHNNALRTWNSFAAHDVYDPDTAEPVIGDDGEPLYQADTAVSLESWHDQIHGLIGTGQGYAGHMGVPTIAGFDPIFWFHHCNVDRLLAIYQALFPDKWPEAKEAVANLYPFRKTETGFWTSNDLRDWTKCGYPISGNKTTAGTVPPESVSAKWPKYLSRCVALNGPNAKFSTAPRVQFTALSGSRLVIRSVGLQTPLDLAIKVTDVVKNIEVNDHISNPVARPPEIVTDKSVLTWNARIKVRKFAFNGSFNIHLFVGNSFDNDSTRFMTKKNEVGFSTVFATSTDAPCANCVKRRQANMMYEDAIPMVHALKAYLKSNDASEADGPPMALRTLESFDPEHMVPFLKANMDWRFTDLASTLIDDEDLLKNSHLEVTVGMRKFDLLSEQNPMGAYYPAQMFNEVTEGKLGGYVAPP